MHASLVNNVEIGRNSAFLSIPHTRIPRRCWIDCTPPLRSRPLPQKPPSRNLQCGCFLDAPTSVQELQKRESTVPSRDHPPTSISTKGRVIAIGDLHGDLHKTIRALELAEVVTQGDQGLPVWSGGDSVVVQLGDVLDRGDCEIGILMLLRELHHQAQKHGGAVYMINGNHESLNVCGNFRYVTPGAFYESALAAGLTKEMSFTWEEQLQARLDLYSPGGLVACELAKNPTVLKVNDTVFAHGGLLPIHVNYGLERINQEMSDWMRGAITSDGNKTTPPYIAMGGPNSILWNRTLARERFDTTYDRYYACSLIQSVLKKVKAKRLVVGHTPQMSGCNSECNGQIWRVDVGMSEGVLNAEPQVIAIEEDKTGNTTIEVVHTKSCNLPMKSPPKKSNIQTALGFESRWVQGHPMRFQWMSKRLVSRLNAQ